MNLILFRPDEIKRFWCDGVLSVPLSDARGGHMIDVLKLGEGDSVKVGVVGEPSFGRMEVKAIKDRSIALVKTHDTEKSAPLNPVTMIIGQVRPICMKRILRDAVCLGIRQVILTLGETCEKSYANAGIYKNGEYLQFLLDGGMQAGSTLISEVSFASSVAEAISMAGDAVQKILLDNEIGDGSLSSAVLKAVDTAVAIGPERGWSDSERKLFTENGYSPMTIGPRIMRTETAVPAGGAVLLSKMGLL